ETFNRSGEIENGRLQFQLKATDRIKRLEGGRATRCRIERADLNHWMVEITPVVLVLYDARADVGYWLHVQHYFRQQPGFRLERAAQSVSVSIPLANVLNRDVMKSLARLKNAIVDVGQEVTRYDPR